MVSVCVDKNWAVPERFFQSLPVPCGAGDKQGEGRAGRPGQPLWGAARGAISIKEILRENRGTWDFTVAEGHGHPLVVIDCY
jgi:hypothetical protein